jgi:hypothetical protein
MGSQSAISQRQTPAGLHARDILPILTLGLREARAQVRAQARTRDWILPVTIPGDLAQDGGRGKMGLGALAPISLTRLPLKLLGPKFFWNR